MKIAIIGAGFTGLSAAFELVKKNHDVSVFEKDLKPGGLAIGYQGRGWEWSLEKHYHHWFTNDNSILNLAKEINYEIIINRPKTSVFIKNNIYQLDSPTTVLRFPLLSFFERLKMSTVIGLLKYDPFWKPLEKYKASVMLPKFMGKKSYEMIWKPLFINKFGSFADDVSLAWFWARIKKRTPSLAYPKGGFLNFATGLVEEIEKLGGKIYFNTEIPELSSKEKPQIKFRRVGNSKLKIENFDAIIVTIPSFLFLKIATGLPREYKEALGKLKSLGATNLILRLNKPFFNDSTYWLSVCDKNAPVMAIVEHTNFMDKKNYNNEHLVYLGNYKSIDDDYFKMTKKQMLKKIDPYLKKINPEYKKSIINYELFKAPFAQPIIPVNYSKILPPFITPLNNVYLANIEQVYPWDRGTNYAVELGNKVAKLIIK
nr:FAD-dependent oxidoreductase [Candidatus Levybacteria bacterium]